MLFPHVLHSSTPPTIIGLAQRDGDRNQATKPYRSVHLFAGRISLDHHTSTGNRSRDLGETDATRGYPNIPSGDIYAMRERNERGEQKI